MSMRRIPMLVVIAGAAAACASTQKPSALTQAESIYSSLQSARADQRVEGDMIRTRATLDTAQTAVAQGQNQEYADGIAGIALRTAQTAEAHFARVMALQGADSLQKLRLSRQLALSQARQAALEAKLAALERQTAAANARADSLRRAAALAAAAATADSAARAAADSAPQDTAAPPVGDSVPRPAADTSRRP
ncbi:MAG: hypothetical protein ACHQTF_10375 [Gemmatimonadales bacterium]